jgi:hypothetical protein
MRRRLRLLSALMIAGAVASPVVITGCMHHQYANGSWSDSEGPHYAQWEQSTNRPHKDYSARGADEQQEYWSWRHSNP